MIGLAVMLAWSVEICIFTFTFSTWDRLLMEGGMPHAFSESVAFAALKLGPLQHVILSGSSHFDMRPSISMG